MMIVENAPVTRIVKNKFIKKLEELTKGFRVVYKRGRQGKHIQGWFIAWPGDELHLLGHNKVDAMKAAMAF